MKRFERKIPDKNKNPMAPITTWDNVVAEKEGFEPSKPVFASLHP